MRVLILLLLMTCLPIKAESLPHVKFNGDLRSLTRTDVVYDVLEDLDFHGREYTVSVPVTLSFEGGSFKNAVIDIKGDPIKVINEADRPVFKSVYFRNAKQSGFQRRCCEGVCKDSWFVGSSDDDVLNMAFAFDGVELTRQTYHLSQDSRENSESYPERYRLLAKSFSISSESGAEILTDGPRAILRINVYGDKQDHSLSLDGIGVRDMVSSRDYEDFDKVRVANDAFIGGALNNFDHAFDLSIRNCSFDGVYQLMQFNSYNDAFNITIEDSIINCGSFGLEIYDAEDYNKVRLRASNSSFQAYHSYVFSFVGVDADMSFVDCRIDGMELYHKGLVRFENCDIAKYITHSGRNVQGRVEMDRCRLFHDDAHLIMNSFIFYFEGMSSLLVKDSEFMLSSAVAGEYASLPDFSYKRNVYFRRCPDAEFVDCRFTVENDALLRNAYRMSPALTVSDDSRLTMTRCKASRAFKEAFAQVPQYKVRIKVLR